MSIQTMPSRVRPDRAPHGRWEGRKGETMTYIYILKRELIFFTLKYVYINT